MIVAAVRFDEKAMQAERLGVGAARHGAKGALGAVAVAGELGRLRAQQQRQRLARSEAVGIGRKFSRGVDVAGADRDQTVGDRRIGARAAALAPPLGQHGRRAHDGADNAPDDQQSHQRRQHRGGHHHQRSFDAKALPGDDHVARPVGEPGHAERQHPDHNEKKDDADHCGFGLLSAASASAASFRLAAMAALRACAFSTHAAASGFAGVGQFGDVGECRGDVGMRRIDADPRHHRGRIVARRRIDRRDADEALRVALEPAEE